MQRERLQEVISTETVCITHSCAALGGIITFGAPGAGTSAYQGTAGESINSAGEIAGQYVDALCIEHGFLRTAGGKFTTFEAPGRVHPPGTCSASQSLQGTVATDINQGGTIAGYTLDVSNVYHGFVRTRRKLRHIQRPRRWHWFLPRHISGWYLGP